MPEGQCKFKHDDKDKAAGREALKKVPCSAFKAGTCRFGESCWMLHAKAAPTPAQPSASSVEAKEGPPSAKLLEQQLEAVASLEALTGRINDNHVNNYANDNDHDFYDDKSDNDY